MSTSILTEAEAKIYDRQIRLWGVKGQQRLRNSRLLIYGMGGTSTEIAKNLVLAGVGNVCLMDGRNVKESDLGYQFFVRKSDVGQNIAKASHPRVQELNPMVKVTYIEKYIDSVKEDFFDNFDVVLMTETTKKNSSLKIQKKVNNICRKKGILFMTADTFGMFGIAFIDSMKFDYEVKLKIVKKKEEKTITKKRSIEYVDLTTVHNNFKTWKTLKLTNGWIGCQIIQYFSDAFGRTPKDINEFTAYSKTWLKEKELEMDEKFISILFRNFDVTFNPVCSVFGGIISQEIIKAICRNQDPVNNFFVYDGVESFSGYVEKVY